MAPPTKEESEDKAGRVELYMCPSCLTDNQVRPSCRAPPKTSSIMMTQQAAAQQIKPHKLS